jgi:hypothetical protein
MYTEEQTLREACMLAKALGVEEREGLFMVADIATVDGSPWVNPNEFMQIVMGLDVNLLMKLLAD